MAQLSYEEARDELTKVVDTVYQSIVQRCAVQTKLLAGEDQTGTQQFHHSIELRALHLAGEDLKQHELAL